MSNSFKLRPPHFSRGAKIFLGGTSPPLVTGLVLHEKDKIDKVFEGNRIQSNFS